LKKEKYIMADPWVWKREVFSRLEAESRLAEGYNFYPKKKTTSYTMHELFNLKLHFEICLFI